jgi:hypothetical protein
LLAQATRILFGRFGVIMGITLLVLLPVALTQLGASLINLTETLFRAGQATAGPGAGLTIAAICLGVTTVVLGLLVPWMEGALTHNTLEHTLGRKHGVRPSYGAARPHWFALWLSGIVRTFVFSALLFGVGALSGLGQLIAQNLVSAGADSTLSTLITVVTIALCAPVALLIVIFALVLSTNWSLRAPAIIGEALGGFEALSRSSALVKGDRLRMFGRLIPIAVLDLLFISAPAFALSSLRGGDSFGLVNAQSLQMFVPVVGGLLVVGALASLLIVPFTAIYLALNYLDLRVRKEGLAAQLEMGSAPEPVTIVTPISSVEERLTQKPFSPPLTPAQRIGGLVAQLKRDGETAPVLVDLAGEYERVGNTGSAIETLLRARKLNPTDPTVSLDLARLSNAKGDLDHARAFMADYFKLETDLERLRGVRDTAAFQPLLPAGVPKLPPGA